MWYHYVDFTHKHRMPSENVMLVVFPSAGFQGYNTQKRKKDTPIINYNSKVFTWYWNTIS